MDKPGNCCLTLGRYSLQKTKNADLQRKHASEGVETSPVWRWDMSTGPVVPVRRCFELDSKINTNKNFSLQKQPASVFLSDLRWSLGCVGVFPLASPLSKALWGDVVSHLPVVADLVGLGHVLETLLITGRQTLKSQQTLTST